MLIPENKIMIHDQHNQKLILKALKKMKILSLSPEGAKSQLTMIY